MSSARHAGESAICPICAQPSAERPPPRFGTRIQLVSERGFGSERGSNGLWEVVSGNLGTGFWEPVSGKWILGLVSGDWLLGSGLWGVASGK